MNPMMLMSALTGKPITYKVSAISFTNGNNRSSVPTIVFSGGGGGSGAAAHFNSTYTAQGGPYYAYDSYITSLNEGIGLYVTPASGNVTTPSGTVVGTYTTTTVSEQTGGGVINGVSIASGGSGYVYPPPVNSLINGTYSLNIYYNNDSSMGVEATVDGTFTNGVLTGVAGLSSNLSLSAGSTSYTVYPTSNYGYIQTANSYATLSLTRSAPTYTNFTKVNSTTLTNAYAYGSLPGYTYYYYNGGWPQAVFGSGSSRSGFSNTVAIQQGVSGTNYYYTPAYYTLNSITVDNTGTGYTIPPNVSVDVNASPFIVLTPTMALE